MESNNTSLDTRVARLETKFDHMSSEITEIKVDLRGLRKSTDEKFERLMQRFDEKLDKQTAAMNKAFLHLTEKIGETKVWVVASSGGLGILGFIAKVLHWIQ